MQTLDAIKTRRTIRKFTEDPVSHEVIEKIVEASAYAPSWKNTQTARYIIIEETALKDRIAKEAVMGFEWNTGIILGAPVLVVLASVPGKSGYEKDGAYSTSKRINGKCLMPVSLRRPSSSLPMNAESVRLSWVFSMR